MLAAEYIWIVKDVVFASKIDDVLDAVLPSRTMLSSFWERLVVAAIKDALMDKLVGAGYTGPRRGQYLIACAAVSTQERSRSDFMLNWEIRIANEGIRSSLLVLESDIMRKENCLYIFFQFLKASSYISIYELIIQDHKPATANDETSFNPVCISMIAKNY